MPFMKVSKHERELIKHIRSMTFDDVYDVGSAISDGRRAMRNNPNARNPGYRIASLTKFYRLFTNSHDEWRNLEI